jgi:hypothetical protein
VRERQALQGLPRPHGVEDRRLVARPFAGLAGETEWVALREIVPSATAR